MGGRRGGVDRLGRSDSVLRLGGESTGSRACRRLHRFCPQPAPRAMSALAAAGRHPGKPAWAGCAGGRCRETCVGGVRRREMPLGCDTRGTFHLDGMYVRKRTQCMVGLYENQIVGPAFARLC